MHLSRSLLTSAATLSITCVAAGNSNFCSVVKKIVSSANPSQQSAASSYCASFLGLQSQTTTFTPTVQGTLSCTDAPVGAVSRAGRRDLRSPDNTDLVERHQTTTKQTQHTKPSALSTFSASATLSSACSCLSPTLGTITATAATPTTIYNAVATPASFYMYNPAGAAPSPYAGIGYQQDIKFNYDYHVEPGADIFTESWLLDSSNHLYNTYENSDVCRALGGSFDGAASFNSTVHPDLGLTDPCPKIECALEVQEYLGTPKCAVTCNDGAGNPYENLQDQSTRWYLNGAEATLSPLTILAQAV